MQLESILVRRATPDDAPAVVEIYNQAMQERTLTYSSELRSVEWQRRRLQRADPLTPTLVVDLAGQLAGWATLSRFGSHPWLQGLGECGLAVARPFRRQGLGRRLVTALVSEAAALGYWKLIAQIFTTNPASAALFHSCGFRAVGVWEQHGQVDGQWVDVLLLERLIPAARA